MISNPIIIGTGFSVANAYTFALAAQAAYVQTPTLYRAETDTAVIFEETPDFVAIGFPGTRNFADVWKDLHCLRVDRQMGDEVCGVHAGFDQAFDSVEQLLLTALGKSRAAQIKPIYIYGHSKGGALATRLAESISTLGWQPSGVYTCGEPRGGNTVYANRCQRLFGDVHFRIEDEADCITRMPGLLEGNHHSGHDVFLTSTGRYQIDPPLWFKGVCDMWEIYQAKNRGLLAIMALGDDHHIEIYVRRLKTLNGIS